jgi:hypothetical protein
VRRVTEEEPLQEIDDYYDTVQLDYEDIKLNTSKPAVIRPPK